MQGESEGKVSKSVTGVVGIEERIREELGKAITERDKVYNVINSVQNRRHHIILYMHHISMMPFGAIASELSKSERNVYKVYKKAVNELEI